MLRGNCVCPGRAQVTGKHAGHRGLSLDQAHVLQNVFVHFTGILPVGPLRPGIGGGLSKSVAILAFFPAFLYFDVMSTIKKQAKVGINFAEFAEKQEKLSNTPIVIAFHSGV